MLLGSVLALGGCGAGQYQIPNVEPVVKQKPQDDLLEGIEGNDKPAESSSPAAAPPASDESGGSGSGGDSKTDKPAPKK
jgi:hypothetical protein